VREHRGEQRRLFHSDPNRGVVTMPEYDPEFFLKSGYCPPVKVRLGEEALTTYERGHDQDAQFVKYLASITKTARECHAVDAQTLNIKVGIAGRVVAGPKGGAANISLPLRIAVVKQHGADVLYTEKFKVPVSLAAPDFAADFSQVFDQVTFTVGPDNRDLIVYVGFDEGPPPGAGKPTG